jgi:2-oxoisovalerate dehydrogenase E1 component alpha subunit
MQKRIEEQFPIVQCVSHEGEIKDESVHDYDTSFLKVLYQKMLKARTFDRKAVNLQRQGRIGTYAPFEGQEAAQIGSAMALKEGDWLFPSYRDHAATITYGHSLVHVLLYWAGRIEGCIPPEGKHIFPPSVPIATQIPHAVGTAWAEKLKGKDGASIVYFGDGATSEGDFHEGLNFASVFSAPVIFFCQNNGYAISVPMERQMKSKTIAQKSLAYDIPGVRVDGNDVLAVYKVTREAMQRARNGEGPTLIEAVTWRYGAHTTADDPTKYRNQKESEERRQFDPLLRIEKLLKANDEWQEDWVNHLTAEINEEIDKAVKEMEAYPKAGPTYMFDHVFKEPTWNLVQQRKQFEEV